MSEVFDSRGDSRRSPLTVDGTIVRYDVYPRELDYGTMVISSFAIPLLSRDTLLNEFLATPHARFDAGMCRREVCEDGGNLQFIKLLRQFFRYDILSNSMLPKLKIGYYYLPPIIDQTCIALL